ncbi:MAG TPA: NAD(P)/FAD-dependent oxidoreductase [Actinomycetes bacterium]
MAGMWDIAVVGAGPAGAAAALGALAARPSARVLLLDRAGFPRDKSCGDGVAPHAVEVLERLGADGAVAGFRPVHRLRLGFAGAAPVVGSMRRAAFVVPRSVLDARVVDAAVARGAVLERHRVRTVQRLADRVVLDGSVEARAVVAADGAGSGVRRQLGVPDPPREQVAIAIRGYAPVGTGREEEQVITFAPDGWPAYAWSFPIGDGRANVGYGEVLGDDAVTQSHLLARLGDLLPGAADGASRWRAHHLPLSSGRPRQPDGRVLLAGDALSLVNPLTGEGIYYAVLSGALAGEAAVTAPTDPGTAYRRALRREMGRHLRHTTVVGALARRRWVAEAGVVAARRNGLVFDDLVEVGLGRGLVGPRLVAGLASGLAVTAVRGGRR